MREEKLYTFDGGYVVTVHVPPFLERVKLIMWGQRIFMWNEKEEQYREEFCAGGLTKNHKDE